MSIDEAHEKLSQFDILLVPGGSVDSLAALAQNTDSPEVNFVKAFSQQTDRLPGSRQQTLFSVCSGALILGAAGALAGITATTHHLCLDLLRDQCAKHDGHTNVVHSRYEVGNLSPNGIRVLTAGGVTAGMDAACYLVSQELSMTDALASAKMNEFTWQTKDETIYPSY
jgi:transcriptional regulator GlxA family with amidase domain